MLPSFAIQEQVTNYDFLIEQEFTADYLNDLTEESMQKNG